MLLVEVTSPSTATYDRSEKLVHYQRIPSLREVVLVSHELRAVDVYSRGDGGRWQSRRVGAGGVVELASVPAKLDVDQVYRNPLSP